MNFAADCWSSQIAGSTPHALRLFAFVLVAAMALADRPSRANPPVTPEHGPAVKEFGVAGQTTTVPGFGSIAQPPASKDDHREQPGRSAHDAQGPAEVHEGASKDSKEAPQLKSYRLRSPYERPSFPNGVPDWFKQRDTDFDGQVFMWEYASSWTDEAARTFSRLDPNGDGVITAQESVSRRGAAVEPNRGFSSSVRRPSSAPPSTRVRVAESTAKPVAASLPSEAKTQPAALLPAQSEAAQSPAAHSIPQGFLAYADGVMKRFDADRDGVLTAGEWTAMPAAPDTADIDGNGQITGNELAVWYIRKR